MNKENKTYLVMLNKVNFPEGSSREEKSKISQEYTEQKRDKILSKLSEIGLLDEPVAIKIHGSIGCLTIQCNEDAFNVIKQMDFVQLVREDRTLNAIGNNKLKPASKNNKSFKP